MNTTTISKSTLISPVTEVLWSATAQQATYRCEVVRCEDRSGKLKVTLLGMIEHVLHEEPVNLTTGPNGQPDLADIDKWKSICADVIDKPERRSCGFHG